MKLTQFEWTKSELNSTLWIIAHFYSTLWIKSADEESPYNFLYMNFYLEGNWYKVSYRRFAHILGFSDNDIVGDKVKIHDYRPPTKDEAK
jgi:hypothetical protein